MKATTADEYKKDIALFFQLSDPEEIDKAAAKQMTDFTRTHHAPKGVLCLEENGEDWFRMTREEFAKI
jgi:hypothetical protein